MAHATYEKGHCPRITHLIIIFDKNSTALLFAFSYCTEIEKKLRGIRNVRLRPVGHAYQRLNIDIAYKNVFGDDMKSVLTGQEQKSPPSVYYHNMKTVSHWHV